MKTCVLSSVCVLLSACSGSSSGGTGGGGGGAGGADTFSFAVSFAAGRTSQVTAIAADATSIVLVGQITGTATFGTTVLTADNADGNPFVARLDSSGKALWAKIATGSSGLFEAVVLDASGNIYVSGAEDGVGAANGITFGGVTLTGGGGPVFKLTSSGDVSWGKLAHATGPTDSGSLALSGTNVVVAGVVSGDPSFDGQTLPTCPGAGCVFLAAYDQTTGAIGWLKHAASTPMRSELAAHPREVWVASDSTGNLFVAVGGYFESTGQADANQLVMNKYDPTGTLLWSKPSAQPVQSGPTVGGLSVDSTGDAIVGGGHADGLKFGSLPAIPPNAANDASYLAKFKANGDIAWAVTQTGSNTFNLTSIGVGSSVYSFGNGEDPDEILPNGAIPMNVGSFDPSTGAQRPTIVCGANMPARAEAISVSSAGVFVAGEGSHPGGFGKQTLTADGLFVAKLKP